MKKFLLSLLFAAGTAFPALAQFQPLPQLNPLTATQGVYVDANFHSVPYAIASPNNGITTVIFDPSTSTTDLTNAYKHLSKDVSISSTSGNVLNYQIIPNIVNMNLNQQETRVQVPFVVANSTTLQTIPFNLPTNLQTNGHYRFIGRLFLNAGNGGSKIDVGGTCSTSNFIAEYQAYTTTTLLYGGQITSFLSGPSGSSTTGQTFIRIEGELDVTNGGTFVIQFAQNGSNATPSVVEAGSTLTVVQIP